jgi:hypothetical protein
MHNFTVPYYARETRNGKRFKHLFFWRYRPGKDGQIGKQRIRFWLKQARLIKYGELDWLKMISMQAIQKNGTD